MQHYCQARVPMPADVHAWNIQLAFVSETSSKQQLSPQKIQRHEPPCICNTAGWPWFQSQIKRALWGQGELLGGGGVQLLFLPFTMALTPGHMNGHKGRTPTQLGWSWGRGQCRGAQEEGVFVGHRWSFVRPGSLRMHHGHLSHRLPVRALTNDGDATGRLRPEQSLECEERPPKSHTGSHPWSYRGHMKGQIWQWG